MRSKYISDFPACIESKKTPDFMIIMYDHEDFCRNNFLLSICAYSQQWNISNTLFKYIFRAHFDVFVVFILIKLRYNAPSDWLKGRV